MGRSTKLPHKPHCRCARHKRTCIGCGNLLPPTKRLGAKYCNHTCNARTWSRQQRNQPVNPERYCLICAAPIPSHKKLDAMYCSRAHMKLGWSRSDHARQHRKEYYAQPEVRERRRQTTIRRMPEQLRKWRASYTKRRYQDGPANHEKARLASIIPNFLRSTPFRKEDLPADLIDTLVARNELIHEARKERTDSDNRRASRSPDRTARFAPKEGDNASTGKRHR